MLILISRAIVSRSFFCYTSRVMAYSTKGKETERATHDFVREVALALSLIAFGVVFLAIFACVMGVEVKFPTFAYW